MDCRHRILTDDFTDYCGAPQLLNVLDVHVDEKTGAMSQNKMTYCEGARDFKFACGHAAKWFEAKQ
jgi:hypothetical protein